VADLLIFDRHHALQVLTEHYTDAGRRRAKVGNRDESARARATSNSSAMMRSPAAEAAESALSPAPGDVAIPAPGIVPSVATRRLSARRSDELGDGITAGTCLVCSYRRSPSVARDLDLDMEWDLHRDEP
jgi:hypothetical protein